MDIRKDIEFLEAELLRLKNQRTQEAAMLDVLPIRFERNMTAFKKYIPSIYEQFHNYTPQRNFKFFCNENGIPNLLWEDSLSPFYGVDPYFDCKTQIEGVLNSGKSIQTVGFAIEDNPLEFVHLNFMNKMMKKQIAAFDLLPTLTSVGSEIPLMLMYGVGLGYQISYIYEKCLPSLFYIIEPDLDLFYASLFAFDWFDFLNFIDNENLQVHIFIGQDKNDIILDIVAASVKYGSYLSAATVGFWHYKSKNIFELIQKTKKEFSLLVSGWGFFDDNTIAMSHTIANVRRNLPFLIKDKFIDNKWESIPVFIVGNGPSLDSAIEKLKKYQNNVVVLSCGSALSALYKVGIKPDIHVQIERTKIVPDSHKLLNDDAFLKDILFLSVDVIHPDCADQFERVGLAFKGFEAGVSFVGMNCPIAAQRDILRSANPLVGNTGVATACRLGFKNIYLFGIDNGFKCDGHHHSKLSFYFDDKGNSKEKLLPSVMLKKNNYRLPGNFGGEVETTNVMLHSKIVMEKLILSYKNINVYNCSDGAMIDGAKPLGLNDIDIGCGLVDKQVLINHIFNDIYRPMDINVDMLSNNLRSDLFDDFVDRFLLDWGREFSSRQQIISSMHTSHSNLKVISMCGYEYIYRPLIGSLNYSFSVILSTLYKFEESESLYFMINEMIGEMREYFRTMKEKYKNTLDCVDRKAHGLFD